MLATANLALQSETVVGPARHQCGGEFVPVSNLPGWLMPIDFNCQGCGKHYRVRDELAGRVAQCKNCGEKMTVLHPAPIDEPPAETPGGIGFADEQESPPQPARQASRQPQSESY